MSLGADVVDAPYRVQREIARWSPSNSCLVLVRRYVLVSSPGFALKPWVRNALKRFFATLKELRRFSDQRPPTQLLQSNSGFERAASPAKENRDVIARDGADIASWIITNQSRNRAHRGNAAEPAPRPQPGAPVWDGRTSFATASDSRQSPLALRRPFRSPAFRSRLGMEMTCCHAVPSSQSAMHQPPLLAQWSEASTNLF